MRERNFEETFQRNFISSVAFEVVFIPLMKIAALIPNFQEKIRDDLPNYQYGFPINVERSIQIPEELSDWIFSSNDEKSYVKVAINRVAYIQTFYDGFENFTNQVNKYLKAFQEITKINKYKRIGLRYKNEFIFEFTDILQKIKAMGIIVVMPIDKNEEVLKILDTDFVLGVKAGLSKDDKWSVVEEKKNLVTICCPKNTKIMSPYGVYKYARLLPREFSPFTVASLVGAICSRRKKKRLSLAYKDVYPEIIISKKI